MPRFQHFPKTWGPSELPKKGAEKEEQYDRAHGDEGPFGQDQYPEHHEKDEEIRGVDEAAAQCERNRRADDDRDRGKACVGPTHQGW
jgi:hypothetical protein